MKNFRLVKDLGVLVLFLFINSSFLQSCGPSAEEAVKLEQYKKGVIKGEAFGKIIYDFSQVITKGDHSLIPTGVFSPQSSSLIVNFFTYNKEDLVRFNLIIDEFEKQKKINVSFVPFHVSGDQIYLLTSNEPIPQIDSTNIILLKKVNILIENQDSQNRKIRKLEKKINKISSNLDSLKK